MTNIQTWLIYINYQPNKSGNTWNKVLQSQDLRRSARYYLPQLTSPIFLHSFYNYLHNVYCQAHQHPVSGLALARLPFELEIGVITVGAIA